MIIVGHRGAMGTAPENTMASFRRGLALGADFLECDVHLTQEGEVVVIHDETLERTTNGKGRVSDHALSRIRRLDAGLWFSKRFKGEKVPRLDKLLSWVSSRKTAFGKPLGLVVELKGKSEGLAEKVSRLIQRNGMEERVLVISFQHETLKVVRRHLANVSTGVLYSKKIPQPIAAAISVGANWLWPRRNLATVSLVKEAHQEGLKVACWTVNSIFEMKRALRLGVDAAGTNFPDRLRKLADAR